MPTFYSNVKKRGNKVLLRYIDSETGARKRLEVPFKPNFYVRSQNEETADARTMHGEALERIDFADIKEAEEFVERYKDVDGFKMYGQRDIGFQFIAKHFQGEVKFDPKMISIAFIDIEVFSGDIDADGNVISGPFPEPIDAAYPVSGITVWSSLDKTFYSFGLEAFKGKDLGTWVHDKTNKDIGHLKIVYRGFKTEHDLLDAFTLWWEQQAFDLYSGWNSEGFDVPYLGNRVKNEMGTAVQKRFSPWGIVQARHYRDNFGRDAQTWMFIGIPHLDYKEVFQKHAFIQPDDWKLETVSQKVLKTGKLSYEEAGSLNTLFITNYQKYMDYNIQDVNLMVRLDEKLQLLGICLTLSYLMKGNYDDALGTVALWSSRIYAGLVEQGIQPEMKPVFTGDTKFAGGFVRVPVPGRFRWVVSCDLNSLYPHLMQQYNLGSETIIEPYDLPPEIRAIPQFTMDDLLHKRVDLSALKQYDIIMTANRQFFRKDKMSIYSADTRLLYATRSKVKKTMLSLTQEKVDLKSKMDTTGHTVDEDTRLYNLIMDITAKNNLQHCLKIAMNSLFGATGNKWFREYFDIRVAEGITLSGQLSIIWIAKKLDEYFNRVMKSGELHHKIVRTADETLLDVTGDGKMYAFYQDTDSCYLDMGPLVDKMFSREVQASEPGKVVDFLDKLFATKIEPFIDESYKELADYMNAYEQRMFMKREAIARAGIWTAKKRYALLVDDNEGVRYPEPELKFMGLEAKKSSTPKFCRDWLEEMYGLTLRTEDQTVVQNRVKEIREEFNKLPVESIAAPRSVNDLEKYATGEIMGIYGKGTPKHVKAALFHNHLIKKLGVKNLKPIASGDKLLYVELKPNPYGFETIGFAGYLPKEFDLHKYVDYKATFEKTFLDALNGYLKAVGWNGEPQASLMDFFS